MFFYFKSHLPSWGPLRIDKRLMLLLFFLLCSASASSEGKPNLAAPFKQMWFFNTDEMTRLSPIADGERVFLPLSGGRIVALSISDSEQLWTSVPGGELTAPPLILDKKVYISIRRGTAEAPDPGGVIRVIDRSTGLILWAHEYDRAFVSNLVAEGDRIYAGSEDGHFYALRAKDGEVIWKARTGEAVRGNALITEKAIYVGSDDGYLYVLNKESGEQLWRFQTGGRIVGRPAIGDEKIFFGSADGNVYALDIRNGKKRWQVRTGAAVETMPLIYGDILIVASYDNFVYGLSIRNGNRRWAERLPGRLSLDLIPGEDAVMVAPLASSEIYVISARDGKRINAIRTDSRKISEAKVVATPVLNDNLLLIPTDRGLLAAKAIVDKAQQ